MENIQKMKLKKQLYRTYTILSFVGIDDWQYYSILKQTNISISHQTRGVCQAARSNFLIAMKNNIAVLCQERERGEKI